MSQAGSSITSSWVEGQTLDYDREPIAVADVGQEPLHEGLCLGDLWVVERILTGERHQAACRADGPIAIVQELIDVGVTKDHCQRGIYALVFAVEVGTGQRDRLLEKSSDANKIASLNSPGRFEEGISNLSICGRP